MSRAVIALLGSVALIVTVSASALVAYSIAHRAAEQMRNEVLSKSATNADQLQGIVTKAEEMQALSIYSAGSVLADGKLQSHAGEPPRVLQQGQGTYRVTLPGLREPPIVVATSNVGPGSGGGARVDITGVDVSGFTVEGKFWGSNVRVNTGFSFLVLRAKQSTR